MSAEEASAGVGGGVGGHDGEDGEEEPVGALVGGSDEDEGGSGDGEVGGGGEHGSGAEEDWFEAGWIGFWDGSHG